MIMSTRNISILALAFLPLTDAASLGLFRNGLQRKQQRATAVQRLNSFFQEDGQALFESIFEQDNLSFSMSMSMSMVHGNTPSQSPTTATSSDFPTLAPSSRDVTSQAPSSGHSNVPSVVPSSSGTPDASDGTQSPKDTGLQGDHGNSKPKTKGHGEGLGVGAVAGVAVGAVVAAVLVLGLLVVRRRQSTLSRSVRSGNSAASEMDGDTV